MLRKKLQKGSKKIFNQLESKVPFKKGHKVKYDSPISKLVRKNGKTMPKRKSSSKAKV